MGLELQNVLKRWPQARYMANGLSGIIYLRKFVLSWNQTCRVHGDSSQMKFYKGGQIVKSFPTENQNVLSYVLMFQSISCRLVEGEDWIWVYLQTDRKFQILTGLDSKSPEYNLYSLLKMCAEYILRIYRILVCEFYKAFVLCFFY